MKPLIFLAAFALGALVHASAGANSRLEEALKARFDGDRSGACVAAALITETVETAIHCNDDQRRPDAETTFEIGSISKTMNGLLLAGLVEEGKLGLDDPIAEHLPKGTRVPEFEGEPIRIRHLLSHTSGLPALPSQFAPKRADDPYADLAEKQLLGSLADVTLTAKPGTQWAYSNFGAMVLSVIVSRASGDDYGSYMTRSLFVPLGMTQAHLGKAPKGVRTAEGHLGSGKSTSAWHLPEAMSGVGGVRASLTDMVNYLQAQLKPDSVPSLAKRLARTQEIVSDSGNVMAWGWLVRRSPEGDLYMHEGGTGGFSALTVFQPKTGKGVVILSDTSLTDRGGLGDVALTLLGSDPITLKPRRDATPDAALLEALSGDWLIQGALPMKVRTAKGVLYVQAQGQSEFALAHDSQGDFFAQDFDLVLTPKRAEDGQYSMMLRQGGGVLPITRVSAAAQTLEIDPEALSAYEGDYPLAPGFTLKVFVQDKVLHAQATGQGAFALVPEAADVFTARAFGIEIRFERNDDGTIKALVLRQGGHDTRAVRK
ncbi:MAG: serine hydrolase [Ahniella sp.]|nr:serine hydrolase [Ahniella sp.]